MSSLVERNALCVVNGLEETSEKKTVEGTQKSVIDFVIIHIDDKLHEKLKWQSLQLTLPSYLKHKVQTYMDFN